MELAMEARVLCSEYLLASTEQRERARDVLYLDIVLSGTIRTIVEANMDHWVAFLKELPSEAGVRLCNKHFMLHAVRSLICSLMHMLRCWHACIAARPLS
jgi:hypothetical protein